MEPEVFGLQLSSDPKASPCFHRSGRGYRLVADRSRPRRAMCLLLFLDLACMQETVSSISRVSASFPLAPAAGRRDRDCVADLSRQEDR